MQGRAAAALDCVYDAAGDCIHDVNQAECDAYTKEARNLPKTVLPCSDIILQKTIVSTFAYSIAKKRGSGYAAAHWVLTTLFYARPKHPSR